MASRPQLDVARGTATCRVIAAGLLLSYLFAAPPPFCQAQVGSSDVARLARAQAAFSAARFEEAANLALGPPEQSADLDYLAGLALARLEHWNKAREAFEAGRRKSPEDARFPVELAGVAYKQKNRSLAKRELQDAMRLNPQDRYALDFLATIYFLDGNLEAALKYWNAVSKPRLQVVTFDPEPKLHQELLHRVLTFNAPQVLSREALADTEARLRNLDILRGDRVELVASPAGEYTATLHPVERNGWGDSPLEGLVSLFSGLPYQTVYPDFYNLAHRAINFTSLARWDSQKRRYSGALSTPVFDDPSLRLRLYVDARDENWNLSQTLSGAGAPLTDLNLRHIAGGAEFRSVVNGRWSWSAGVELAHRDFRNVGASTVAAAQPFFAASNSAASWLAAERALLRVPENRFALDSSAQVRAGRNFTEVQGPFVSARGTIRAHWFPRASGDDYETLAQMRAGATAGKVPLDELFQLGLERDNDLWLRGQPGTIDGRKGAAPLGRRYFLVNLETDKNVYRGAFFRVKVGPFLDNGAIADSSGLFGSRRWLWDAGAQCKLQILGSVTVALTYGRDLRAGHNVYYGTTLR